MAGSAPDGLDPYAEPAAPTPEPVESSAAPAPSPLYAPPTGYPAPWPEYGPYPPPPPAPAWESSGTEGMAIASLILGIFGLVCAGLLAAVPAVVLGHLARGRIRRTWQGGAGMALAGLILGYVTIGINAVVFLFWVLYVVVIAIFALNSGF